MLVETPIAASDAPLSEAAVRLVETGRARFRTVSCFDFVPCDYEMAWRMLDAFPRGRFCEWGSGWGIVTGLAELLGFQATGVEIDEQLAVESRRLLADCGLSSEIRCGDYFSMPLEADLYFVYCWPGRILATEDHFERTAPSAARLLIAHGQSDFRCKRVG